MHGGSHVAVMHDISHTDVILMMIETFVNSEGGQLTRDPLLMVHY